MFLSGIPAHIIWKLLHLAALNGYGRVEKHDKIFHKVCKEFHHTSLILASYIPVIVYLNIYLDTMSCPQTYNLSD